MTPTLPTVVDAPPAALLPAPAALLPAPAALLPAPAPALSEPPEPAAGDGTSPLRPCAPRPEPAVCRVAVEVTGGLTGAERVISLLRSRRYPVRELRVRLDGGAPAARLDVELALAGREADLLVERLRRLPAVLDVATG